MGHFPRLGLAAPPWESDGAESRRLLEDDRRTRNWKRWGPYLAERQWATVREDYSEDGNPWKYFPHEHARSRVYRWGEDGLLGLTDRECRLCFGLALWNRQDPILKERLFGLTGPEGNHGEDVKECYFYLDATPTHSYLKSLYKYPQRRFPYERLVVENGRRGRELPEFELGDSGMFEGDRYFDVTAEYAKAGPDDVLIRITIANRGPEAAPLHLLTQLWFRNTWCWGRNGEGYWPRPLITAVSASALRARHASLGTYRLTIGPGPDGAAPELLFTENETNRRLLYQYPNPVPWVKDAFHERVVKGAPNAVNPERYGTKAAAHHVLGVAAHGEVVLRLRLFAETDPGDAGDPSIEDERARIDETFDGIIAQRIEEANEFYAGRTPPGLDEDERRVLRQAYAGLVFSRQFYHFSVEDWLGGDPAQPTPPESRRTGRNAGWSHLYNRDVLSVPDKWEYPWYAAWDLGFHAIPFSQIDPGFAKEQLLLLLREWYMHPNGQIPAYEFELGDVNPPVHPWAVWRVYKMTGPRGGRDRAFLARAFHKLLLNFTWWVNRKDIGGKHVFAGGFLGLDNIGVFDRSKPLPTGGVLEQADGTAWMAFYCTTMLSMALELARGDPSYEDIASKFFEHFVAISDAMNAIGGSGLWSEEDGFYYDQIMLAGQARPLRVRSMVGLVPLLAAGILKAETVEALPGFSRRMKWFLHNRKDLARHVAYAECQDPDDPRTPRLLAIPSRDRLVRVLGYLLDENEFLSPFGVRSLSRAHDLRPFVFASDGVTWRVDYEPGESRSGLFGGNSNWRGPIWLPMNYLLIEALEKYHHFYGSSLRVECPVGSGTSLTLGEVAHELSIRVCRLFQRDEHGSRPCHGRAHRFTHDPHWRDLLLFHEYFHGETGEGLGASHQCGWTALITRLLDEVAAERAG